MMWRDVRPGDVFEWNSCVDLVVAVEHNESLTLITITLLLMWVKNKSFDGEKIHRCVVRSHTRFDGCGCSLLVQGGQ